MLGQVSGARASGHTVRPRNSLSIGDIKDKMNKGGFSGSNKSGGGVWSDNQNFRDNFDGKIKEAIKNK